MSVTDREVYEEIAPDLMRYATALVGPDHAPNVVSTVVARALNRPGGLVGLDNCKTYLMKAVLFTRQPISILMASRAISTISLNVCCLSSELVAAPVRIWSDTVQMVKARAPFSAATP